MPYTQDEILQNLDNNGGMENPYGFLPMLEDAYLNVSSNKIHLFADQHRWAIVFEMNGYHNRRYCVVKELHYFGNCLENLDRAGLNDKFVCNAKSFVLFPEEELVKVCDEFETVSENAKTIKIRELEFPIEKNLDIYKLNQVPWNKYDPTSDKIDFPSMVRMLNFNYPDVFNSTASELKTCLPKDLPNLMTIEEWYYTNCSKVMGYEENTPSVRTNETYNLIAEILVSKDITRFKLSQKPNSDWRNWNSGDL